jgi:hypothetical protein
LHLICFRHLTQLRRWHVFGFTLITLFVMREQSALRFLFPSPGFGFAVFEFLVVIFLMLFLIVLQRNGVAVRSED